MAGILPFGAMFIELFFIFTVSTHHLLYFLAVYNDSFKYLASLLLLRFTLTLKTVRNVGLPNRNIHKYKILSHLLELTLYK